MEEIIKKIDALLDTKFEKIVQRLDEHDKRFDGHDKRFDEHTEQIDIIARKLADHTERFDRIDEKLNGMANKDDIAKIMNVLDGVTGLIKKHDDEITVINHNHRALDRRVEVLEHKI